MGNFIADAMAEHFGADLAIINGGFIRGDKLYEEEHRHNLANENKIKSVMQTIKEDNAELMLRMRALKHEKAALEAHCRQLAYELLPRGITVNSICAGVTRTAALEKIPGADVLINKSLAKSPVDRLTHPEDVAGAIAAGDYSASPGPLQI